MAMLFPFHTTNVPLKWEDSLWIIGVGTAEELVMLRIQAHKEKIQRERDLLMYWNEKIVGMRTESEDEEHETDE